MKKKVFSIIGVAAFAVAVAINLNISANRNKSDLVLANVEALANGEIGHAICYDYYVAICFWAGGYCWPGYKIN